MALFIMTMILLMAFTTNIGMLVHAKINLQNAADAAAYAGAAVQARQLTSAAYLNWEMRRALKEFLFYYQIRSQYAAMPCFPNNVLGQNFIGSCPPVDGDARHDFAFFDPREGNNNEINGPFLPSVCIIFTGDNNYCQKFGVPGIPEFQGGGSWGVADPIVAAVRNATNQIIDKKINDCLSRTDINRQFLAAWLFNLDPIAGVGAMISTGRDSDDPFPFATGPERVGILPRMAILRARIDNFEEMLNMNLANEGIGSVTINDQAVLNIKNVATGTKSLDYFERPIQAFLSAKNNLPGLDNNGIFANVELTELIPNQPGGIGASGAGFDNTYVKNPPILAKFKDQFSKVALADSVFVTKGIRDRGDCFQYREKTIIPHFPYGISKDPTLLTYYAVRLEAKARLLFSPFGGNGIVTLSALSAAKPFGSRIGKDLSYNGDSEFHQMKALGKQYQEELFLDPLVSAAFPNVLVSSDDNDTQSGGFARNSHLGYIRQAMLALNRLDVGPRLAGAYAPWEVGYYTVPANYNAPNQIGLFEDNPVYDQAGGKYFSLAAPIMPVNGDTDLGFLTRRVEEYLLGGPIDKKSSDASKFDYFKSVFFNDLKWAGLFGFMDAEGQYYRTLIPDPLLNDDPDLLAFVKSVGQRFTVAASPNAQLSQLTSWNNQKTSSDQDLPGGGGIPANSELGPDIGRSGYSVRFVSFKALQSGGQGTNDPIQPNEAWNNPFPRVNAGANASYLQDVLRKTNH
jgi:Putative Flp pilus-assembly TadE/G-like